MNPATMQPTPPFPATHDVTEPNGSSSTDASCPNSGRLVAADGRELILTGTSISARAGGGLARVMLEQVFTNPYDEPLTLTAVAC